MLLSTRIEIDVFEALLRPEILQGKPDSPGLAAKVSGEAAAVPLTIG